MISGTRGILEERHLLVMAVFAHVVSVVRCEDHDRLIRELQSIESVEQTPNLHVHERNGGVVGAHGLAHRFVREVLLLLVLGERELGRCRQRLQVAGRNLRDVDCRKRILLKVFLGHDVRRMRAIEADRQEELRSCVPQTTRAA